MSRESMGAPAILGHPQDEAPLYIIRFTPTRDLIEPSEATQADILIVQTAIAYAGGLDVAIDLVHITPSTQLACRHGFPLGHPR